MAPMIQPGSVNSSIIPQPRGNRAMKSICFFILLCLIILYLNGVQHYTYSQCVYGMAIHAIFSQAWHLVISLCEFSEEINHLNTRYNGEYLRAFKVCFCMRHLFIIILTCTVCYIFYDEDLLPGFNWVINLTMLFLCNLLGWLCGLQKPTPAAISEITEKRHLNVAHGLAWSYYVGYLKFVLPALKESVKRFNEENNNLLKWSDTCRLHILIPLSCKIYGDLKEMDANIKFVKEIPPLYIDRAGIKARVFKNNVYRILDEDHRPYYCIVEYATPLASLYEMSDVASAAFSKEDRIEQAKLFCRTLKDILENSLECQNSFRLVIYDDCPNGEVNFGHLLSHEILKHLKQQHSEEYDLSIRV